MRRDASAPRPGRTDPGLGGLVSSPAPRPAEDLQAWRDRCARAMGWEVGHFTIRPDEDANQALLMRDACDPEAYLWALKGVLGCRYGSIDRTRKVALASRRDIAEAALQVLEARQ